MTCYHFGPHNVKRPEKFRHDTCNALMMRVKIETKSVDSSRPNALARAGRHWTSHKLVCHLFVLRRSGHSEFVSVLCEMSVALPNICKWHYAGFYHTLTYLVMDDVLHQNSC